MELTGGIEVRITGGTPLEVLARITAWGLRCCNEPRVYALASQIMELENKLNAYDKDGNPAPSATPATPAPAAAPADPSGPVAGETGPSAAPTEAADPPAPAPEKPKEPEPAPGKAPSLEDIRAKGIEAAKKYGQPAIKAILKELGAENMTNLPEDKRAVFLEKLEGLGENNA